MAVPLAIAKGRVIILNRVVPLSIMPLEMCASQRALLGLLRKGLRAATGASLGLGRFRAFPGDLVVRPRVFFSPKSERWGPRSLFQADPALRKKQI